MKIPDLKELNKICQKPDYKKKGNWMARNITRDMALPFTWLFLHTSLTANQVTFVSLMVGLAGCFAFAAGGRGAMFVGVFFLQLWYLLDHVDGQIARYRKQSSLTGIYLDYVTHYLIHAGIFLGIGYGAFKFSGKPVYLVSGFIAALGSIFLNLVYDVMYKAYFSGIERSSGFSIKDRLTGKGRAADSKNVLRKIFSNAHKLCEVHVLMNIVTLLAALSLVTGLYIWGPVIVLYAMLTMLVAIMKNVYFVLSGAPDKNFKDTFKVESEG